MNSSFLLFGMDLPSPIWTEVLSFLIVGLLCFAITYIHRYMGFAVLPLFLWLAYYMVQNPSFSRGSSGERLAGYSLVLADFAAVVFGAFLSWKKYKIEQSNLK
jgi:hypothetical protein